MAAPTDQELKNAAKEAMMKILSSGQSYTIGSRKLQRVDFDKVAEYLAATSGNDDPSGDTGLWGATFVAEFEPR